MRKLKFHEQKLLKKVDFFDWKNEKNIHEIKVLRRYHVQDREDYTRYNKICGMVTSLVCKLKLLPPDDKFRMQMTEQLLEKLFNMGLINSKHSLQLCEKLPVSSFCRRRLPIILQQLKFAETNKEAVAFIEQGRNRIFVFKKKKKKKISLFFIDIRIGTDVTFDPCLLVTRTMEDHITWVDGSAIQKKIMKYKDKLDDYDLMN